jgi:hypothetical protein
MSFSDERQEYLLVKPPQSNKPGKHSAHNLQIQRLLTATQEPSSSPSSTPSKRRRRILPILNLESHAIRKTRVVETDTGQSLCRFDRDPKGVIGRWQTDVRAGNGGGWVFTGQYDRYEWAKSRGQQGEDIWKLVRPSSKSSNQRPDMGRRRSTSDAHTNRSSDDASPERRLCAKMTMRADLPPLLVISPRNPRAKGGSETPLEVVNKEEIINALIQGLWIVWREGIIEEISPGKRNNSVTSLGIQRRNFWDKFFCRG